MKTHTLEAGQFIEFINPWKEWNTEWNDVNCGNTNEMSMWPSQRKMYCCLEMAMCLKDLLTSLSKPSSQVGKYWRLHWSLPSFSASLCPLLVNPVRVTWSAWKTGCLSRKQVVTSQRIECGVLGKSCKGTRQPATPEYGVVKQWYQGFAHKLYSQGSHLLADSSCTFLIPH